MARVPLLAVGLTVLALAFSPWLYPGGDERQPIPDGSAAAPAGDIRVSPVGAPAAEQPGPSGQEAPRSDSYCLTCHSDRFFWSRFADGQSFSLYVDARELRGSAHALLTCVTCHDDHEVCPPDRAEPLDFARYQAEAAEMCASCHLAAAGSYADSVHGEPVLSGEGEGATCNDCHSPDLSGHTTAWVSDPEALLTARSVHENCGRCHEQELSTYEETSHSKVAQFGDPHRPATCTTCHGDHAVKAVDDPREPLTAANLVAVCSGCHDGADEEFAAGWLGHETPSSLSAGIYYAERFTVLLIAAGLGFGLVHIALDLWRRLADLWRPGGDEPM